MYYLSFIVSDEFDVKAELDPTFDQIEIDVPCQLTFSARINGHHKIKTITSYDTKFNINIEDDNMSALVSYTIQIIIIFLTEL